MDGIVYQGQQVTCKGILRRQSGCVRVKSAGFILIQFHAYFPTQKGRLTVKLDVQPEQYPVNKVVLNAGRAGINHGPQQLEQNQKLAAVQL